MREQPHLFWSHQCSHSMFWSSHPLRRSCLSNSAAPPKTTKEVYERSKMSRVVDIFANSFRVDKVFVGQSLLPRWPAQCWSTAPPSSHATGLCSSSWTGCFAPSVWRRKIWAANENGKPIKWAVQPLLRKMWDRWWILPIPLPLRSCISPPTNFCSPSEAACPGPAFAPSAWGGGVK